ncbi:hypothetical protein RBB50_007888 [Rhinocladiella similis]
MDAGQPHRHFPGTRVVDDDNNKMRGVYGYFLDAPDMPGFEKEQLLLQRKRKPAQLATDDSIRQPSSAPSQCIDTQSSDASANRPLFRPFVTPSYA